ncbi:Endonuclease/Exonuclease/phosphatase family protein [Nitrosomonas sp. Nm51]|uniref:endonuclease/exonuclease/phosphatase family protein n=1 Tax=Nitrosomonas sp. Nm51 TaxID=133720 RepID=UPI0008D56410|nr:GMP synthase [Nitrosomonas sp. Nm51]SER41957.1 Endonuclease/Exonuclease/phosphatase family protein [Nitrosomonas sp. Nm51]
MAAFTQSTAKIACWNLAGYHGLTDDRLDRQAEGLGLLDAEVVVLVEINPESALQYLRQRLLKKGIDYHASIIPQTSRLKIGFLYKDGVVVDNPRLLDGSDLGVSDKRKAYIANVTIGKFDFQLIAVHLKSGRGKAEQQFRDDQCKIIGAYITRQRAASREDILLLGDFNMIPGQDVSNFHHLGGDDLMDFISSWDSQDGISHILPKGRANLLDGFAISRNFSTEYIRGSLRVFPMHWAMDIGREAFRADVSDHLPFVASFRIDRSRD